jgi:hypothetical protein
VSRPTFDRDMEQVRVRVEERKVYLEQGAAEELNAIELDPAQIELVVEWLREAGKAARS